MTNRVFGGLEAQRQPTTHSEMRPVSPVLTPVWTWFDSLLLRVTEAKSFGILVGRGRGRGGDLVIG